MDSGGKQRCSAGSDGEVSGPTSRDPVLTGAQTGGESLFQTLASAVPDLVWMSDGQGRPLYQNPAWRSYTGLDDEAVSSGGWQPLHHPDELGEAERVWREAAAQGLPFEFEGRMRRYDGEYRWFSGRTVPLKDAAGTVLNWVGTLTDIHVRKQTEKELAEAAQKLDRERERLAIALRAGGLGVYEWRVGENTVWWSPETYRIYGVEPSTEMSVDAFTALVHPDDREELWRKTAESIASGELFRHEYRIIRRDGAVRWIFNQSEMALNENGEVERVTGVTTDVTEQRELGDALKEADHKKDQFLSVLAHELRNPLAPVRNGLEILRLSDLGGATVARVLAMMGRQLEQMVRLIDDLMDITRIRRGQVALVKSRMDLAVAVRDAVDVCQPLIDERGHELNLLLPVKPTPVDGDGTRLAQVFSNLLGNAAKYTQRGGRISVRLEEEGSEAVVSVDDNGVGIPATNLQEVFEMFTRVKRASEEGQGGLGIGLNIVKRLVEMHGGRVAAFSGGGTPGSRFVVRIPLATSGESPEKRAALGANKARRTVLIVDDNQDGADSLSEMLALKGNETRTAYDGMAAIEAAEAFRPDVILMDLGMPHLDGYETCRRIRERPWGRKPIIVAQTGWGQEEDRRRSAAAGFDFHLVKPVDVIKLEQLLAGVSSR